MGRVEEVGRRDDGVGDAAAGDGLAELAKEADPEEVEAAGGEVGGDDEAAAGAVGEGREQERVREAVEADAVAEGGEVARVLVGEEAVEGRRRQRLCDVQQVAEQVRQLPLEAREPAFKVK